MAFLCRDTCTEMEDIAWNVISNLSFLYHQVTISQTQTGVATPDTILSRGLFAIFATATDKNRNRRSIRHYRAKIPAVYKRHATIAKYFTVHLNLLQFANQKRAKK
jgi:hypothetical protein